MKINFLKRWRNSKLKSKHNDGKLLVPAGFEKMTEEEMRRVNGGVPIYDALKEVTEE